MIEFKDNTFRVNGVKQFDDSSTPIVSALHIRGRWLVEVTSTEPEYKSYIHCYLDSGEFCWKTPLNLHWTMELKNFEWDSVFSHNLRYQPEMMHPNRTWILDIRTGKISVISRYLTETLGIYCANLPFPKHVGEAASLFWDFKTRTLSTGIAKVHLPGERLSSIMIRKDRIFIVLMNEDYSKRLNNVRCIDMHGKTLWDIDYGPHWGDRKKMSFYWLLWDLKQDKLLIYDDDSKFHAVDYKTGIIEGDYVIPDAV